MARRVSYREIRDDAADIIGDVVYGTMATVDKVGRPRSRVLIVVWELDDERPHGWLGTYRTPVKPAHIANNPHVTTSYWSPRQNVVALDSVAAWDDTPRPQQECGTSIASAVPVETATTHGSSGPDPMTRSST